MIARHHVLWPADGLTSTATQAAVCQAPAAEIGTASGLQRTATYIGAITSTSLPGPCTVSTLPTTACIVAIVMGVLSTVLLSNYLL